MQSVRCAVIGAGWWGTWAHVPALAKHPRAELVAVQHHLPDEARRVATDFDVPHALTTAEEVLAMEDLDAVSSVPPQICTTCRPKGRSSEVCTYWSKSR